MASEMRMGLEKWLKTIDVEGTVIDFGGSQKELKGRTKSWNPKEYKIADCLTQDSGQGGIQCILKRCVISMWELDIK